MEIFDYETLETYLGDLLRRQDCLDIHADRFFPVTLLDLLFHYSEDSRGTEQDGSKRVLHRNFHGHDFDRWIDNLVAHTQLTLADDEGNHDTVQLVDIDSLTIHDDETVTVMLPDDTTYTLLDKDNNPVEIERLTQLAVHIDLDTMFDHAPVDNDSEPYMGFGAIAHIVRVVCDNSGIDVAKVNQHELSQRIFNHFKNEMLPLIPSLWNDMEHIMHYSRPTIMINK